VDRFTAFDAATRTGVAYGCVGTAPAFETWDLRRESRGAAGLALMSKLSAHLSSFKPDMVFIEEPLAPVILSKIGATADTAIMLPGYVFLIETVCASVNTPTALYNRQRILTHFTGRATWPKIKGRASNAGKLACESRCHQLRWPVADLEQADAAALWDYGAAQRRADLWARFASDRPHRSFTT
jgi:hypothetical protein